MKRSRGNVKVVTPDYGFSYLPSHQTCTTDACQEGKPYCLGNVYSLTFEGVKEPVLAELNKEAVYHSIYCDENVFDAIGIEGCVAMDNGLAKGGTEAIAGSFYSVMKSQQCIGGQSNEILALK